MTVGKIYAGLLIAENWKAYKTSQSKMGNVMGMVSNIKPCSGLFQWQVYTDLRYEYLTVKLTLTPHQIRLKYSHYARIINKKFVIPTECTDSCRV